MVSCASIKELRTEGVSEKINSLFTPKLGQFYIDFDLNEIQTPSIRESSIV